VPLLSAPSRSIPGGNNATQSASAKFIVPQSSVQISGRHYGDPFARANHVRASNRRQWIFRTAKHNITAHAGRKVCTTSTSAERTDTIRQFTIQLIGDWERPFQGHAHGNAPQRPALPHQSHYWRLLGARHADCDLAADGNCGCNKDVTVHEWH
jgi:hypothetical protein